MEARLRQIADYLLVLRRAAEVNPLVISPNLLPHFFVLEIGRSQGERAIQLRIRLAGTAIDQYFGRRLVGHHLEDFVHGPRGGDVIEAFHRCAGTHEPLWMRQIAQLHSDELQTTRSVPRFVEGVTIYLEPDRIYGGLIVGDAIVPFEPGTFQCEVIAKGNA